MQQTISKIVEDPRSVDSETDDYNYEIEVSYSIIKCSSFITR